jgi:hypothetical protein
MQHRWFKNFLFVALVLAVQPSTLFGQDPPGCRISKFPAPSLCERSGLDTLSAAYLLVVDESKSMVPIWPAVQAALREFVSAIQTGDQLEVLLFSGRVQTLIPPTLASQQTRGTWSATLSSLPPPRGSSTDLGIASEAIVKRLASAPTSQMQFVFLLTDGKHEPAPGSLYVSGENGFAKLHTSVTALLQQRLVSIDAVRLTPAADLTVLETVFPNLTTVEAFGSAGLHNWFESASRQVALEKLKLLISRDLSRPAWTLVSSKNIAARADVESSHDVKARSNRRLVTTVLAENGPYELPNGGHISFPSGITQLKDSLVKISVQGPSCAWWKRPASCGSTPAKQLRVKTRLEPADELSRIGIDAGARSDSLNLEFSVASGGYFQAAIYYPLVLLALSVIIVTLLKLRWSLYRPKLHGRIIFSPLSASAPPAPVLLTGLNADSYAINSDKGEAILELQARAQRGRSVVYAVPKKPDVQMNGKPMIGVQRLDRAVRFRTPDGDIHFFPN